MNGKNLIIGLLAVTTIASSGAAIYFGLNKNNTNEVVENVEVAQVQNQKDNTEAKISESIAKGPFVEDVKVVGHDDMDYKPYLRTERIFGVQAAVTSSNEVSISITDSGVDYFKYENSESFSDTVTFKTDKKVLRIYNCQFGQGLGQETIVMIMEDGTVEYMPIAYAIKNNDFRSYGKIEGIENAAEVMYASAHTIEPGMGYIALLVVEKDGTAHDLTDYFWKLDYYKN